MKASYLKPLLPLRDIVIFPSKTLHSTQANVKNNERISLSADVTILAKNSKNLEINFIDNKDSFNEDEWTSLYKLSENTFVEETDSLKKGAAGAGLTDND